MNTFRTVILCSVVAVFQSFRATYNLLVQGRRVTNANWSTKNNTKLHGVAPLKTVTFSVTTIKTAHFTQVFKHS